MIQIKIKNSKYSYLVTYDNDMKSFVIDIYEDGNINQASNIVKELIQDKKVKSQISSNAYHSITCTWNSHVAADRLIQLIEALQNKTCTNIFREGPCSVAPVLVDNWYKKSKNNEGSNY